MSESGNRRRRLWLRTLVLRSLLHWTRWRRCRRSRRTAARRPLPSTRSSQFLHRDCPSRRLYREKQSEQAFEGTRRVVSVRHTHRRVHVGAHGGVHVASRRALLLLVEGFRQVLAVRHEATLRDNSTLRDTDAHSIFKNLAVFQ